MTTKPTDPSIPTTAGAHDERRELFDRWAASYDDDVARFAAFPFAGYDEVLDRIVTAAAPRRGAAVLDLGTGTGALAARFVAGGCEVIGLDFSAAMLDAARARVPGATFVQAALTGDGLPDLGRRFDVVGSAYTFHELPPSQRLALITRLVAEQLAPGGVLVVGDISFPTTAALDDARRGLAERWDDREFYLVADEELAALARAGFDVAYEAVSFCAAIYTIRRRETSP